jgi:exonuclease SbcC
MEGFGPFRERQCVDFDSLSDSGLFLIHGRTGAGKSTILDAIVYAVYGHVPRYASQPGQQVRSQHCGPRDPSLVEVEFTTGNQRYRVRRTPEYERPKARGDGTTLERPTAELARWDGHGWEGLASQVRDVGHHLHELVPFSAEQFLQVVLLAQGDFQRFLIASSKDRQSLLRTLFDSGRFEQYDAELQRRAGQLRERGRAATETAANAARALAEHVGQEAPGQRDRSEGERGAGSDADWAAEVVAALSAETVSAETAAAAAAEALEAARCELTRCEALLAGQRRRERLRTELVALDARRADVDAARERLQAAVAAAPVQPTHAEVLRARTRAAESTERLDKAVARHAEVLGCAPAERSEDVRDGLLAEVSRLEHGVAAERERDELAGALQRLTTELTGCARERAEAAAWLERAEEVLLTAPRHETAATAERLRQLADELAQAQRHQQALRRLRSAEEAALVRGEARTRASALLDGLRRRRLEEYAGALAAELSDGHPCSVCGSTEHPAPAVLPEEAVTPELLAAAEEDQEGAARRAATADEAVVAARVLVEESSGARAAGTLAALLDEARAQHEAALVEHRARADAASTAERLRPAAHRLGVREAVLQQQTGEVRERISALDAVLDRARGEADTVAERRDELLHRLEAVTEFLECLDVAERDGAALDQALRTRESALEHQGFGALEDCLAALLPADQLARLRTEVTAYDDARTSVVSALAAADLHDLPTETVDPAPARVRLEAADDEHRRAVAHLGAARQRERTALLLREQLDNAWARTSALAGEWELVQRLANSVHGEAPNTRRLRLENYVLAVQLEEIVRAANQRLAIMSTGRYELGVSDVAATRGNNSGLDVRVLDQHTGASRTAESLSGGERFLASLALALGLAEVVSSRAGGINLETLFIDEGFGALDAETLDLVMATLDELRANGRSVGVISHVEALKERIGAQVLVEAVPGGASVVRQCG